MNYPEVALDYVYEKHILINRDPETATRLVDELGVHLDESATPENPKTRRLADIIIEMLEHPKNEIDFDRKLFYVFSLPHGRFAAYGASMILKGATTAELERFKEAMGKMPFQYQLLMVTSVDLRRTLYGVRGSEYETGWGDLFAAVMGHAQNRVQRKELIMELDFMIRQNDISLGKEERSIVLALHKAVKKDESNDPPRPPSLGRGEEEEDFASLLRRRCTLLLLQNSYQ